jgi:small conductance mechanosensitive channel
MDQVEDSLTTLQNTLQKLIDTSVEFGVNYSFQVFGALVVLLIGFLVAGGVSKALLKSFEKKQLDITLSKFIASIAKATVIAFAVLIALGKFGITIAPFIAALGALTFGASLALSGPLSNYGAGVTIIVTRPFVVGNTITVAGASGVVQEVKLACTILSNEDGVRITIPNKHIVGEILHNSQQNKIVEGVVGISYSNDPEVAVRVVREALDRFSDVVKTPLAQVGIQEFGDSSVNIGFRYWVPTAKFFQTSYQVNLAVYKALQGANINIPFPQRDLHIVSQPSSTSSVASS